MSTNKDWLIDFQKRGPKNDITPFGLHFRSLLRNRLVKHKSVKKEIIIDISQSKFQPQRSFQCIQEWTPPLCLSLDPAGKVRNRTLDSIMEEGHSKHHSKAILH